MDIEDDGLLKTELGKGENPEKKKTFSPLPTLFSIFKDIFNIELVVGKTFQFGQD